MELEIIEPFVAYHADTRTLITLSGKTALGVTSSGKTEEVTPPSDAVEYDTNKSTKVALWGDNNDFPQKIDEEIEKNPTLAGALKKKIEYLYAGGIEFLQEQLINNELVYLPVVTPEIRAIRDSFYMKQYLAQSIYDYCRYGSVFPEMIFSLDKSKVAFITASPAFDSRWAKQSNNGYIEEAYINANWALGRNENSADTITNPVLDPFIHTIDFIKADTSKLKYIFRSRIATSKTYYPLVDWWSVKTSDWLDVSNYVPKFKKSLMLKKITADFHIEIDIRWLEVKYGELWSKASPEEKNQLFKDELKHFNEMRQGPNNAGGNIMTTKFTDPDSGKEISSWKINDLKSDGKSGEYIEDSNEADSKIHYAVGLDMTMSNTKSGSGMGSGSGSDKREAFGMEQSTKAIHEEVILAPIYFWLQYNGLNPDGDIKIRMKTPFIQTLNNVSPSQRTIKPQA